MEHKLKNSVVVFFHIGYRYQAILDTFIYWLGRHVPGAWVEKQCGSVFSYWLQVPSDLACKKLADMLWIIQSKKYVILCVEI